MADDLATAPSRPDYAESRSEKVLRFGGALKPTPDHPFSRSSFHAALGEWLTMYAPESAGVDFERDDISERCGDLRIDAYRFSVGGSTISRYELSGPLHKEGSPLKQIDLRIELQEDAFGQKSMMFEMPQTGNVDNKSERDTMILMTRAGQRLLNIIGKRFNIINDGMNIDSGRMPEGLNADIYDYEKAYALVTDPARSMPVIVYSSLKMDEAEAGRDRHSRKAVEQSTGEAQKHVDRCDYGDTGPFFGLAHYINLSHAQARALNDRLKAEGHDYKIGCDPYLTFVLIPPGTKTIDAPVPPATSIVLTSKLVLANRNPIAYVEQRFLSTILGSYGCVQTAHNKALSVRNMRRIGRLADMLYGSGLGQHSGDAVGILFDRLIGAEEELLKSWADTEIALDLAQSGQNNAQEHAQIVADLRAELEAVRAQLAEQHDWGSALEEDNARLSIQVKDDEGSLFPPLARLPEWINQMCSVIINCEHEMKTVLLGPRADLTQVPAMHRERVFQCVAMLNTFGTDLHNINKASMGVRDAFQAACKKAGVTFGYSLSDRAMYDRYGDEYKMKCPSTGEIITLTHHFRAGAGHSMFRMYLGYNSQAQAVIGPVGQLHLQYTGTN